MSTPEHYSAMMTSLCPMDSYIRAAMSSHEPEPEHAWAWSLAPWVFVSMDDHPFSKSTWKVMFKNVTYGNLLLLQNLVLIFWWHKVPSFGCTNHKRRRLRNHLTCFCRTQAEFIRSTNTASKVSPFHKYYMRCSDLPQNLTEVSQSSNSW